MHTWSNILFYVVFLSQILLISYYFPAKILARMKSVLETYPPSQYPKLYPKPVEYYKMGQMAFKFINLLIMLLGFILLFVIAFVIDHASFADDGYISEAFPAVYGMLQFVPLMIIEFAEFGQFKAMRKASSSTTRTAVLHPRRLFGFVSPKLVGLAVGLFLATIVFDFYLSNFLVAWGNDTMERALVLTVTNMFLAAMGAWQLYGRKLDPHQASADRAKQLTAILKSLIFVSMAMSVFFATQAADDVFNMDFLDATLLSVYFQAIILVSLGHVLRNMKLEDINFDVYKNNEAVA